jgi:hypothetical protein
LEDDTSLPIKNPSMFSGWIRVAFFYNRIEIENPGILLPGMTIEDGTTGFKDQKSGDCPGILRTRTD